MCDPPDRLPGPLLLQLHRHLPEAWLIERAEYLFTQAVETAWDPADGGMFYGFDLEALLPLAEQFCPTKEQVANPIDYSEIPERAKGCPGMNPLNQREEVVA